MPKLIEYPRTSYSGAWELCEIVDDTGGKCAIETAARKLNRKVSGSFKAIIGSAVKFSILTSKRDLLTTTTLFKRIKHAYDKEEELLFHREAFLTPPLFTQICRKFRSRELPVQMLDVMLIREFGVEEINAQGVAKAFVDGCHMMGLLDEHNIIADIDDLGAKQPRRELANSPPIANTFRNETTTNQPLVPDEISQLPFKSDASTEKTQQPVDFNLEIRPSTSVNATLRPASTNQSTLTPDTDAIANLFGLVNTSSNEPNSLQEVNTQSKKTVRTDNPKYLQKSTEHVINQSINSQQLAISPAPIISNATPPIAYQVQISGPGINTVLTITEEEDINLIGALLEKIRRQLKSRNTNDS